VLELLKTINDDPQMFKNGFISSEIEIFPWIKPRQGLYFYQLNPELMFEFNLNSLPVMPPPEFIKYKNKIMPGLKVLYRLRELMNFNNSSKTTLDVHQDNSDEADSMKRNNVKNNMEIENNNPKQYLQSDIKEEEVRKSKNDESSFTSYASGKKLITKFNFLRLMKGDKSGRKINNWKRKMPIEPIWKAKGKTGYSSLYRVEDLLRTYKQMIDSSVTLESKSFDDLSFPPDYRPDWA